MRRSTISINVCWSLLQQLPIVRMDVVPQLEHRMRIATLLTVPLLAVLIVPPARASAQMNVNVSFGTRLGPEIPVYVYSPERRGDWRKNYRRWKPVTLYDVNGRYYRNHVRGARPVLVYIHENEYFLPPQDQAWKGSDKRYDYQRQPTDVDYGRAHPYIAGAVVDARLGQEVGVLGYSAERARDWHANVRHWRPVTLYEVNGRYYSNNGSGARPVAMYRYKDEYFLPPTDQAWVGADKRFDYKHQPNDGDRGRVRERP